MKTPTGRRWLVVALLANDWRFKPGKAIGCVRAETEQEAFAKGEELLVHEVTKAIPMADIDDGWRYGG